MNIQALPLLVSLGFCSLLRSTLVRSHASGIGRNRLLPVPLTAAAGVGAPTERSSASESLTQAAACTCADRCGPLHIYWVRPDVRPVVTDADAVVRLVCGGIYAPRPLLSCRCSGAQPQPRQRSSLRNLPHNSAPLSLACKCNTEMFALLSLQEKRRAPLHHVT